MFANAMLSDDDDYDYDFLQHGRCSCHSCFAHCTRGELIRSRANSQCKGETLIFYGSDMPF